MRGTPGDTADRETTNPDPLPAQGVTLAASSRYLDVAPSLPTVLVSPTLRKISLGRPSSSSPCSRDESKHSKPMNSTPHDEEPIKYVFICLDPNTLRNYNTLFTGRVNNFRSCTYKQSFNIYWLLNESKRESFLPCLTSHRSSSDSHDVTQRRFL